MDRAYSAYLSFARGLADRFADRVIGLDPSLERIVNARPADQVLGGFLTPAAQPEADEYGPADDLPQDSAYEQTSLGLEWLAPYASLTSARAEVAVQVSLYVRVFPSYSEQERYGGWRRQYRAHGATPQAEQVDQEAEIIPAWRRVDLDPITSSVDLAALASRRKLVLPLTADLQTRWRSLRATMPQLYGRASSLRIAKSVFRRDSFEAWCAGTPPTQLTEDWAAELDVRLTRVPTELGCGRISLRVVNRTPNRDQRAAVFFDPNLYAVRVAVTLPTATHRDMVFRELKQSYRYDLRLPAVGLNAHPVIERRAGTVILQTDAVPRKEAGRLEPRELNDARPTFLELAREPVPLLRRLLEEMERYDRTAWQPRIDQLSGAQREEAERDRERFRRDEIRAFSRGIDLLADGRYPHVRRAFELMNEAIGQVAKGWGIAEENRGGLPTYAEWRLFQIVFVVSQLPMLAAREYPELERPEDSRVEILWFAAGGGKTEAFLGLVIWEAFFDRLRGKLFGTAAMVRFPLRLLAFQQLQRMSRALAAADTIRTREHLAGARFSLGYYVGGTQTPNMIDEQRHAHYRSRGLDSLERRIAECPYCGADVEARYEASLRMIEHHCTNSACEARGERLPVYIVDRDIERFLPTVIVATVDKLAQFGQQQRFANLFGRISLLCGKHGASFLDVEGARCEAAKAVAGGNQPTACGGKSVLYPPFKDLGPSLLVQDELHLLST